MCLAVFVLLSLVNRIFHKRSDGLEQFLFYARRGMCLFHLFSRLRRPNSVLSASTLCFSVFSVNAFELRRDLIPGLCLWLTFSLFSMSVVHKELNTAFVVAWKILIAPHDCQAAAFSKAFRKECYVPTTRTQALNSEI